MVAGLTLVALLHLPGPRYGVWDPWEVELAASLESADSALDLRRYSPGQAVLARQAFSWFGIHEWSARLFTLISGLLAVCMLGILVGRLADRRAAVSAMLIACTTPLWLLNTRLSIGAAPQFFCAAAVALGAGMAVLARPSAARYAWLLLAALGIAGCAATSSLLLGALPALLAPCLGGWLLRHDLSRGSKLTAGMLFGGCLLLGGQAARAIYLDAPRWSLWTGGVARGDQPIGFDGGLEQIFHGMAPWSALLPLALAWCTQRTVPTHPEQERAEASARTGLQLMLLLWAALGYVTYSLYTSRFGSAVYPGALALAGCLGLWLSVPVGSRQLTWVGGLGALLFTGLLARDMALFPERALGVLPGVLSELPEKVQHPQRWHLPLSLFAVALVWLLAGSQPERVPLQLGRPYRWLGSLWRQDLATRVWLTLSALLGLTGLVLAAVAWLHPDSLRLSSLAITWARRGACLALLPPAVAIAQILWRHSSWVCRQPQAGLWLSAVAFAGYTTLGYLPTITAQLSPRAIFEQYEKLSTTDEPLLEFGATTSGAAFYLSHRPERKEKVGQVNAWLQSPKRRWVVMPRDELANLDGEFRRSSGRHLFVPSSDRAPLVLAANHPVKGAPDHNPLARIVLKKSPPVQHQVKATLADKVELLGYDLRLPHRDSVGPGETFTVSWVFKALRSNLGKYKVFVHVDGEGRRLNGDHEAAGGEYPVHRWQAGDLIVDEQRLTIPASYRPGTYTLYVGLFRGSVRMPVTKGPRETDNRISAGSLHVR